MEPSNSGPEWFIDDSFWQAFYTYMFCLDYEKTRRLNRGCWELREHPFYHGEEVAKIVGYLNNYWSDCSECAYGKTTNSDNVANSSNSLMISGDCPYSLILPSFGDSSISTLPGCCRHALDLGCGVGRHAFELARLGFAVTAVDTSPFLLGIGRSHADTGAFIDFCFTVLTLELKWS